MMNSHLIESSLTLGQICENRAFLSDQKLCRKKHLSPLKGTDENSAKQSRPFALFILPGSGGERWIDSPCLSPYAKEN
jgi:hypothetical protein